MAEPRFDVSRVAAVALTRDAFLRIREEDAVEVLPPVEPGEDALAPGHSHTSLFQAGMVAVRASVRTLWRFDHAPPHQWPVVTVSAVAVLRDPRVFDSVVQAPIHPSHADEIAIQRAKEPLLAALREWGAIPTPVEWYVWACEKCGRQYQGPSERMDLRRCPNHPDVGPLWSRYRVVPAPGETEIPENVACGTEPFPRVVWCANCQNGSTWDEGVDLGGQGPDGDRTARCCPFCREPRPGSERPDPVPTRPDPGDPRRPRLMGHAPPRPRSPRERPFQGAGYYPPTAPWSVRRSPTVGQAASSVLAGMVTAAIFFAEGTPTVFGVAAALTSGCLVALLVDRVEQILRPAEPTRARWLAEPPLSLPGLSDHAARTYYAAAVQALMDDAMTPAEFEAALDLLWHEPKKAVADQRMKAAVARVGREVVWESDGERQYRRRHSGPSDAEVLAVQVEAGAAKTVAQLIESGSLSPAAARETLGMLSPAFLTEEQVQREIARPDPDQLERRRT